MARVAPRVVVTAGPTREHLDDVRYLTNASTGRMGYELAREARRRGASVTLVLGPVEVPPLRGVTVVPVVSTRDLLAATRAAVRGADLVVFAAAPADWRPKVRARGKIKKDGRGRPRTLVLLENPDVAATLGRTKGRRVHVGFALEVRDGLRHARGKLARKHLDAIVLNGPENLGVGGGDACWITVGAEPLPLPTGDKRATARAILDQAFALLAAAPRRQTASKRRRRRGS